MNNNYKILVVDDDEDLRSVLVNILEASEYNVKAAENGHTAGEMVQKERFDLVISDIQMADCDGIELLENMKKTLKEVPAIIFITGYHKYTDELCFKSGARAVLHKPFSAEKIIDAVNLSLNKAAS